jgi:uncharacterized protein
MRHRWFWLFAASWLVCFALLAANGQPMEEPIFLLLILGLALPGIALLVCRGLPKLPPAPAVAGELALLAGLVVFIAAFLAIKGRLLSLLLPEPADPRLHELVNTLLKLVAFVAIPLAAYALRARLSPRALGLRWPPEGPRGRSWLAFGVLGAALVVIQLVLGRGARPLLDGSLSERHWILAVILCFVWVSLEAGLVEEVFFRVILQSRLAAATGSQASGLFLSALIFGLAHAPGLWLRGAGGIEGLGDAPSLAVSIAYGLTTMGVAGMVFGVLWMRTRNWLLVVALHGLTDALSNAPEFLDTWGL